MNATKQKRRSKGSTWFKSKAHHEEREVPQDDAARLIVAGHPWPPPCGAPLTQCPKFLPAILCPSLSCRSP
jgi:hypothetical protein